MSTFNAGLLALEAPYRKFELPWTPDPVQQRRFRRLLGGALLLFAGLAIVLPLVTVKEAPKPPALPDAVVQLVLEPPPPPPKQPPPEKKTPVVKAPPVARPVPRPVDRVQQARRQAKSAGLIALQDELKDLREAFDPSPTNTRNLSAKVDGPSRAERSIITSNAGAASGGVSNAPSSRGFGGGVGSLKGAGTTQSVASFGDSFARQASVKRDGQSGKAARSREEVELMFDRNKSALYALYNRALRDNPALQGKLVVQLEIAPSGAVTEVKLLSSELGDSELERKLLSRIKGFQFEAKDVEPLVARKTIEFFPG
jgi:TonB family protein